MNLWALLLGAMLFAGFGAVSLSAEDMKCGAGKCGNAKKSPAMKCGAGKCGSDMKAGKMCPDGKHPACICGENKPNPKCECPHHKGMKAKGMKCGAGMKCGGEKKEKMKCGSGKCGSN